MAAIHLKDLIKAQQQQEAAKTQKQERMSVADLKKLMGLTSENTKKTTEVLGKIETLSVQSNTSQQEQVEHTKNLLEKDDGTHTRLDDIKATLDKTLIESKNQTKTLEKIDKASETPTQTAEQVVEGERAREEQNKLLKEISGKLDKGEKPTKEKIETGGIGGLFTTLALAIGGAIAAIRAQIKTIQLFARAFLPESLINLMKKKTASFLAGLSMRFDLAKAAISEKLAIVTGYFDDVVKFVKNFFTGEGRFVSTIKQVYNTVKDVFITISEPFQKLFKFVKKASALTDLFAPITNTVKAITAWVSKFKWLINVGSKLFKYLLEPIAVIMTLYDTIKGAFEGWQEGGLVGMVRGAISGFFKSLIGGLLDGVKSLISWVLGAFGFDQAEKFLDSFSFEDIIDKFFRAFFTPLQQIQDLIMHPIDTIKKMGQQISDMLESIGIPEISFTIPIIDKKVSIGPYYPFKKNSEAAAASDTSKAEAPKKVEAPGKAAEPGATPTLTEAGKTVAAKAGAEPTAAKESRPPSDTRVSPTAARDKTSVMVTVAGEPVVEGKPLSEKQVAIVESQMRLGNDPSPEVKKAYDLAKSGAAAAPAGPTAAATAPAPTEAGAVYNKSADNAQTAVNNQGAASAPVVVNAPVTTTVKNDQNISMSAPVRNTDRGFNRYMQKNSVFI